MLDEHAVRERRMTWRDVSAGGLLCAVALVMLAPGCDRRSGDGGEGGSPDASGPSDPSDPSEPSNLAAPRLITPLPMATVTQRRPTLRWVLGDGRGTPAIDVCEDRACTRPLSVTMHIADDHRSAVPTTVLPSGWLFWRVRVVAGTDVVSSRTWQFWVGASSASTPVDTSNGAILDVNGDGYPDFLVAASDRLSVHLYLGSAAVSAGNWNGASPAARIDLLTFDAFNSKFGVSVASAGDVNGDGYADFLIGCPGGGAPGGGFGGGVAYLYLGSPTPSAEDWNGITARKRIDLGSFAGPSLGGVVAGVGDVDGDGYADFLVSGFRSAYDIEERVWLYLGSGTPSAADWSGATSTRRVELEGPDVFISQFGGALASAGDVNGDGYADFVVGAWGVNTAYVYLGSSTISDTSWNGSSPGKRIDLTTPDGGHAAFGLWVAGAGDINGDGYADFLISAQPTTPAPGIAYLYLGSATVGAAAWNQASSAVRVDLTSPLGGDFGSSMASAGDVNGDGYQDFLIGAPDSGTSGGAAHLYLGSAAASATDWNGGSPARRIDLTAPDGDGAHFGSSMASAGYVNGDGYIDFLVGADGLVYGAPEAEGAAYLYLGSATMNATRWNGPASDIRFDLKNPDGAGAHFGNAVASMGVGQRAGVCIAGSTSARLAWRI